MRLYVALALTGVVLDPTVVALIGTIMGGVGLKIVEWWLSRNKVKFDDAAQIRTEQRTDLASLRAENRLLETERDDWREKYYKAYESLIFLKAWIKGKGLDPPE